MRNRATREISGCPPLVTHGYIRDSLDGVHTDVTTSVSLLCPGIGISYRVDWFRPDIAGPPCGQDVAVEIRD
ncbi:hypothetical protein PIB30_083633 [Stylosanthes scabra]|uniref:Uncharacterized protein n=1 Tax=Stylosanthes scabra TaxID=79078 RepID=A0ABU6TSZ5_9FABA|nr:hypothetical protein [Stylosanthes scabra]